MNSQLLNYENLLKVTNAVSSTKNPEKAIQSGVLAVTDALGVKGAVLFLFNKSNNELEIAGSCGLSEEYLNKGPISALQSIASSLKDGPVAIFDVLDDPRIQYPEEAKKEGIASILSVPIMVMNNIVGALRVYTSVPWEFTLEDVNFVQAVAQILGMNLEMIRMKKGLKNSIEILKTLRDPNSITSVKRTPFEGVPLSINKEKRIRLGV